MFYYFLVVLADLFLAANFVAQKKYQKMAGISSRAGLVYNCLLSFFTAVIFLVINGGTIAVTLYSLLMAFFRIGFIILYILIGFKLMDKSNMSLYTLFLMSGGMTLPYIWGVIFLNEPLSWVRTLGLLAILAALVVSNLSKGKVDKEQILLCVAVFILNGFVSILSKMHQINPASQIVTASDFVFISAVIRFIICTIILLCMKKKTGEKETKLSLKPLAFIVFLAAAADGVTSILQLVAAENLPATVLYPFITGGAVILTALASAFIFKEKLSAKQWTGVCLCFIGTLLFL